MAAIDDLNAKIDALKTTVDQLIALPAPPVGTSDAAIEAVSAKVDAIQADVNAKLAPPAP